MDNDFKYLETQSCEELGLEGYCSIACSILCGLHPDAEVWRLGAEHDDNDFAHVFLKVNGKPLDIKGFRAVEDMIQDIRGNDLIQDQTNWSKVNAFSYKPGFCDSVDRNYLEQRFKKYIYENLDRYT